MTAIARRPDAAVTRVEVAPRRWSRDYEACQGWGAAEGQEHHTCTTPEGAEFDQGRCYRCHRMHQGWLVAQKVVAEDRPAPAPRAITLTVSDADPAPPPDTTPVPTPQEIVPRAWHKHYDCCVQCATTDRKHAARGLCTLCYPPSTSGRYTGHAGPRLDRTMTDVEQRALVDAYLATITIPTPAAPTAHATPVAAPPPDPPHPVIVAAREAETRLANADEPQWEVFGTRAPIVLDETVITWRKVGLACLSPATMALLGNPTHVVTVYDAQRRLFGVRAATADTPDARKLRAPDSPRSATELSITAMVRYFGLADVPTGRYPVIQFGPVVAIQLPPPTPAQP